jgi:nitrate/nitrite transporter NarK
MLPYFWWSNVHNLFISLWQTQYHWSAISTAIHTFPLGLVAFAMTFTGGLTKNLEPKWLILGAQLVVVVATILFNWTDAPEKYWRFVFPAFFIGSAGAMLTFTNSKYVLSTERWLVATC